MSSPGPAGVAVGLDRGGACGARSGTWPRALVAAGLALARADGIGAFLSTGTERNVEIYRRCGFRLAEVADAPEGGPTIYFMRWDPRSRSPEPTEPIATGQRVRRRCCGHAAV